MPSRAMSTDNLHAEALRLFANQPVNRDMIAHLARAATGVVNHILPNSTTASEQQQDLNWIQTELCRHGVSYDEESALPTLEQFISHLVNTSKVGVMPLMSTLVYLTRLKSRLEPTARGLPSTPYRIFLASLILAVKFLDDCPRKNKRWVKYSRFKTDSTSIEFYQDDVNEMETQLILLLDWDLAMREHDLCVVLKPFLEHLRRQIAQRQEIKREIREGKRKQVQNGNNEISGRLARSNGRNAHGRRDRSWCGYLCALQTMLGHIAAPRTSMASKSRKTCRRIIRSQKKGVAHGRWSTAFHKSNHRRFMVSDLAAAIERAGYEEAPGQPFAIH